MLDAMPKHKPQKNVHQQPIKRKEGTSMLTPLELLEKELDDYIAEALNNLPEDAKVDALKVPKETLKKFLRYNLAIAVKSAENKKEIETNRRRWNVLKFGLENNIGEIPLGVLYKGIFIYTETMERFRTPKDKKNVSALYYKKINIATLKISDKSEASKTPEAIALA